MSQQVICLSDSEESVDNADAKDDTEDFNFPSVDFLYDDPNAARHRAANDEVNEKPAACSRNVESGRIINRAGSSTRLNELFDKYSIGDDDPGATRRNRNTDNGKNTKISTQHLPLDDDEISRGSRRIHATASNYRKTGREEEPPDKLPRLPQKEHRKNLQPGECLKSLKVSIDEGLSKCGFHSAILDELNDFGVSCKLESLPIENSIMWTRKAEYPNENNDTPVSIENEIIIVWNSEDAARRVEDKSFASSVETIASLMPEKKLLLVIYGTEEYFRCTKKSTNSTTQRQKNSNDTPKMSKRDLEFCLAEVQLCVGCNCKLVDRRQELGMLIRQLTKSIAEKPLKLEKRQRLEENVDWYATGDNRDTVKVDKNGNGLKRLWRQQLCQFNLASLETSEAISNVYPSPFLLMQAYENCDTFDGERLLSDIPIRRAAGPLSTVRKIGPELSKKIFIAFTSRDGETLLINDRELQRVGRISQKNR